MAGSFREGAEGTGEHGGELPPLSHFLAALAVPSWGSSNTKWHRPGPVLGQLRRVLASSDHQTDELRGIRNRVHESAGKAKEKARSLHEAIQKLDKYKNIVTRKRPTPPPPPLSHFLAALALPSWGSSNTKCHHPELRRALASSDDQTDELRRIRNSVHDSAGKAKEKVRSLHEAIQKLDKYKNQWRSFSMARRQRVVTNKLVRSSLADARRKPVRFQTAAHGSGSTTAYYCAM